MIAQEVQREIHLLEDVLNPSETRTIIDALLEQVANMYKLKRLSEWVGDHHCDSTACEYQLEQVTRKKEVFRKLIDQAAKDGREIKLDTQVSIRIQ